MTTEGRTARARELTDQRLGLYRELVNMAPALAGSEWHTDRVREMEWLNRQLEKLGVIPGMGD